MLSRRQVEVLRQFQAGPDAVVVSLYLDVSAEKYPRREYQVTARKLLREARESLDPTLPREVRRAAEADLERMEQYVGLGFQREGGVRGLSVFACEPRGLWQVYGLPGPVPDLVVPAGAPYLRPLWLQLHDYPRFGVVMVERAGSRFLTAGGGQAREVETLASDVPSRVRRSGWAGLKGRRIERHIDDHVQRHLKEVAGRAQALAEEHDCDYVVVGGNPALSQQLLHGLASPWRERVLGTLPLAAAARPAQVLEAVTGLHEEVSRSRGRKALEDVLAEVRAGGNVVTGLPGVLRAVQEGAATTVVVDSAFNTSGCRCPSCGYLDLQAGACPRCARTLVAVADLVTELMELALERGCQVERVGGAPRRDQLRGVGALLRYLPTPFTG
ncbi:MAG: Vms1/Ankzf1 family peptidyl-tRNA hydrolase [Bacillota bacterium]|nr:Vms1/Ankzf1 family peptidyl-tRNA hydrolase [Bacillota bacterium]